VRREGVGPVLLFAFPAACAAPPPPGSLGPWPPPLSTAITAPEAARATATPAEPDAACAADADCGYDPLRDRCRADPRANRQPPIVDQGVVCYCEEARCAALRVPPVPCESDASCAVRADPRPHPVAAGAAHPHERGKACRDFVLSTTCERTNLCTLHRLRCPRP
jgi:hypothetical protein